MISLQTLADMSFLEKGRLDLIVIYIIFMPNKFEGGLFVVCVQGN
jgi:hypothetical protein